VPAVAVLSAPAGAVLQCRNHVGRADRVDRATDGLGMRLDQIDILRVAQRLVEEQLVDRRTATERDLPRQRRRTEQVA